MTGKTITYSFLGFQFIPTQHQLKHLNQIVQLSKKSHDLLLALVESNGQVLEKDQIIELIWPNQIVTDAALNKQITRLRQTLAEYDQSLLIETVRGVGVRFVPEVYIESQENNHNQTLRNSTWVVALVLFIMVSVIWMWQKNQSTDAASWDQIDTINMAIIPAINNDDWLNVGAVDYLSEQLLAYQTIQTIKPEINWFNQSDAEVFAIELSQTKGIEYVLILQNQSIHDGFSTDLSLRSSQEIIAKHSLKAKSISLLLQQIEAWTLQQLEVVSEINKTQTENPDSTTEFVMENYLRGLAAAQAKQYSQAQRLLKTATDEDPKFFPAWFSLADVESELGHFDKALGLIDTLAETTRVDAELQPRIQSIKAKILVYLNRLEEAQKLLDSSTQAAQVKQNINIIMKNLATQVMLNDYQGGLTEADVLTQKKLLQLTQKFAPAPNQIAQIKHNLAVNYRVLGHLKDAETMIDSAIELFNTTNNAEGQVSSYRVLGDILAMQAKNGEALLAMEKALPFLDQVEGARTLANFWMSKARSHFEQGELTAAKQSIEALHQMSVTYSTLQPKVKAWIIETELAITYDKLAEARTVADQLMATILENPDAYPNDAPYAVALDLYTDVLNGQIETARTKKQQYLNAYPQLAEWISDELKRIDAYLLVADGYQQQATERLSQLEQTHLSHGDILTANYIAIEIIEILKTNQDTTQDSKDSETIELVINRVKNRPHFVYPINKYQAKMQHQQGKYIAAITLMTELKTQAKDFWTTEDQLLLENWQQQNSQAN